MRYGYKPFMTKVFYLRRSWPSYTSHSFTQSHYFSLPALAKHHFQGHRYLRCSPSSWFAGGLSRMSLSPYLNHLRSRFTYSSNLKMEATFSSEPSVTYQTTLHHILCRSKLHTHRRNVHSPKLKWRILMNYLDKVYPTFIRQKASTISSVHFETSH